MMCVPTRCAAAAPRWFSRDTLFDRAGVACVRVQVGNHPNAYFAASQAYYKDKAGAGGDAAASDPSAAQTGAGSGAGAGASSSFVRAPTSPSTGGDNKRGATAPAEAGSGDAPVSKKQRTAAAAGEEAQPVAPAGSPGAPAQ